MTVELFGKVLPATNYVTYSMVELFQCFKNVLPSLTLHEPCRYLLLVVLVLGIAKVCTGWDTVKDGVPCAARDTVPSKKDTVLPDHDGVPF